MRGRANPERECSEVEMRGGTEFMCDTSGAAGDDVVETCASSEIFCVAEVMVGDVVSLIRPHSCLVVDYCNISHFFVFENRKVRQVKEK